MKAKRKPPYGCDEDFARDRDLIMARYLTYCAYKVATRGLNNAELTNKVVYAAFEVAISLLVERGMGRRKAKAFVGELWK